jgi:hypothetical protein
MPNLFKWRVAILDDNKGDLDRLKQTLEAAPYNFLVYGVQRADDFFGDALDKICSCHAALVDMVWENFADINLGIRTIPPYLWAEDTSALSEEAIRERVRDFVLGWIGAVQAWTSSSSDSWKATEDDWPRSSIDNRDVGLWLAGLLSHVNEECEIILFSGGPKVGDDGHLAALGRFRDAKYQVVKKSNLGGVDVGAIIPALTRVQARLVTRDIKFRRWFIGSVLVSLVVGAEPARGETSVLTAFGSSTKVTLDYRIVFPQLSIFDNQDGVRNVAMDKVNLLLSLLPARLLLPQQRVAIEAVLHDLDPWKLESMRKTGGITEYVWQLLPICFHAGDIGINLSSALVSALSTGDFEAKLRALRLVWKDAFSMLFSSRYSIAELCKKHGGTYTGSTDLEWPTRLTPEVRSRLAREPQVRVNMEDVYALVSVLRNNAEGNGAKKFCLRADEDPEGVVVTWYDDSTGFHGISDFQSAVRRSVEKGVDRGLPCALASAFRLGADEVWVLVGEPVPRWHQLFPDMEEASRAEADAEFSYGYRLRIPKSK